MADINGKQNIQTDDAGDLQSQIVDSTTPSQGMTVNTDGQAHVLAHGNDGTSNVVIPIDATSGGVKVDIVDATGLVVDVDIDQFEDGDTQQAGDKGNVAVGSDGTNYQFLKVDTTGRPQVDIAAQTLTAVAISADNNANSPANPIYTEVASAGDPIHVYTESTDTAFGATHTVTHTVNVGKTFKLQSVESDCSGKCKVVVQVNGSTVSRRFVDVAAPGAVITYPTPIEVPAGQDVDVIITNRSPAQDLSASINGVEV